MIFINIFHFGYLASYSLHFSYADASISSQSPILPQMAFSRLPFLPALFIIFVRQGRPVTEMQYVIPRFTVRLRNDSIKQRSGLGFLWLTYTIPVSRRVHTCSRTTSSSWHSRGFPVWQSVIFIGPESDHWLCLSLTD